MLLTIVEICLGIIFVATCFVDYAWIYILFWIIIVLTIIDALIRARIYAKHTFRCKDCGKSFTLKGPRLFNVYAPWRMPIRVKNRQEIEPRMYSRSWIKCLECGSYECVIWLDE
jgi:ribosomal protein S14